MKRVVVFCVTILALAVSCAREQPGDTLGAAGLTWYRSFEDARRAAEDSGDFVLLSFEAPWCPWSHLMKESLFVHQAVMESLASYRCVSVDPVTNPDLPDLFGVVLYPTVVVTDAYGRETGRMVGYHTPREFIDGLSVMSRQTEVLSRMFKQEEEYVDDPVFLIAFGRLLRDMGMYDAALIRYDRALHLDVDNRHGTTEEATYSLAECFMLEGEFKEAGRRFRLFASELGSSERAEEAYILAGLCYEKAGQEGVASRVYQDYVDDFADGRFTAFAQARLDSLRKG
jgi:thioredoxin-related protein